MSLANDLKQIVTPERQRTTWETFLHRLWSAVEVGPECEGCGRLRETPDAYGTGDSPSDYECKALSATGCGRLFEDECDAGRIAEQIYNESRGEL